MTRFDLESVDRLLTTTRAVRRRLDVSRPVEPEVIETCLRLALQAPSGSNDQPWRWLVVTDPEKRRRIAEWVGRSGRDVIAARLEAARRAADAAETRLYASVQHLLDHLAEVPVHVVPCVEGRLPADASAIAASSYFGSILPAIWSFQLALRSRGLGSVLTTLHLVYERKVAELLDIPEHVAQIALLPVAYTRGEEFRPAPRRPLEDVSYWNSWGVRRARADPQPGASRPRTHR